FRFSMIRGPPRSTPFPTRRSSDLVVIAHGGGIATLYGHLLQTNAAYGQKVARGQLIGLEGSSGYSTGPHLHFELRVNDQVADPIDRKSTRLNSSHDQTSYAVFCLK